MVREGEVVIVSDQGETLMGVGDCAGVFNHKDGSPLPEPE